MRSKRGCGARKVLDVEEVSSGAWPIEVVGTAVAAFVGLAPGLANWTPRAVVSEVEPPRPTRFLVTASGPGSSGSRPDYAGPHQVFDKSQVLVFGLPKAVVRRILVTKHRRKVDWFIRRLEGIYNR